ncbi:hypothetical protein A3Q56_04896 [Intoshia linei]|uniref:Tetraspanin n=1 Tax=Intoshia linei TaxID=1819745 RepID=A0A177B171_9BILA|nr:hypothetical protein A3Q56_04896 [Intoshia linei]
MLKKIVAQIDTFFQAFNLILVIISFSLTVLLIIITTRRRFLIDATISTVFTIGFVLTFLFLLSVFVISICGYALKKTKINLTIVILNVKYIIVNSVLFLFLLGICIICNVYYIQINDLAVEKLQDSIKLYYGINFENRYNRYVTRIIDEMQYRLHCCGARSEGGWMDYRESKWFKYYGANDNNLYINRPYRIDENYVYVPSTCCSIDPLFRYIDKKMCQTLQIAPPGSPTGGMNPALNNMGCVEATYEFMSKYNYVFLILTIMFLIYLMSATCGGFMKNIGVKND